jgi:hypothetical protein
MPTRASDAGGVTRGVFGLGTVGGRVQLGDRGKALEGIVVMNCWKMFVVQIEPGVVVGLVD